MDERVQVPRRIPRRRRGVERDHREEVRVAEDALDIVVPCDDPRAYLVGVVHGVGLAHLGLTLCKRSVVVRGGGERSRGQSWAGMTRVTLPLRSASR